MWLKTYKSIEKLFDYGNMGQPLQYGDTVYYKFYPHILDKKEEAKLSIMESFGINVIREDVGKNYENAGAAYDAFINKFTK